MKPIGHIAIAVILAAVSVAGPPAGDALAEPPLRIIYFERPP